MRKTSDSLDYLKGLCITLHDASEIKHGLYINAKQKKMSLTAVKPRKRPHTEETRMCAFMCGNSSVVNTNTYINYDMDVCVSCMQNIRYRKFDKELTRKNMNKIISPGTRLMTIMKTIMNTKRTVLIASYVTPVYHRRANQHAIGSQLYISPVNFMEHIGDSDICGQIESIYPENPNLVVCLTNLVVSLNREKRRNQHNRKPLEQAFANMMNTGYMHKNDYTHMMLIAGLSVKWARKPQPLKPHILYYQTKDRAYMVSIAMMQMVHGLINGTVNRHFTCDVKICLSAAHTRYHHNIFDHPLGEKRSDGRDPRIQDALGLPDLRACENNTIVLYNGHYLTWDMLGYIYHIMETRAVARRQKYLSQHPDEIFTPVKYTLVVYGNYPQARSGKLRLENFMCTRYGGCFRMLVEDHTTLNINLAIHDSSHRVLEPECAEFMHDTVQLIDAYDTYLKGKSSGRVFGDMYTDYIICTFVRNWISESNLFVDLQPTVTTDPPTVSLLEAPCREDSLPVDAEHSCRALVSGGNPDPSPFKRFRRIPTDNAEHGVSED